MCSTQRAHSILAIAFVCLGTGCGSPQSYEDLFNPEPTYDGGGGGGAMGSEGTGGNVAQGSGGAPSSGSGGDAETQKDAGVADARGRGGSGPIVTSVDGEAPRDASADAVGVMTTSIGRCATGLVRAKGDAPLIADFEPKDDANGLDAFKVDGRSGRWFEMHDSTVGAVVLQKWVTKDDGKRAVRYQGSGLDGWGATVGISVAPCYDASAYAGISFWSQTKRDAGADKIKFELHTPVSEPIGNGGACAAASVCEDHFTTASLIEMTETWTQHTILWGDLRQSGMGAAAPQGYHPEAEILSITIAPAWDEDPERPEKDKSFDFNLDDVAFVARAR